MKTSIKRVARKIPGMYRLAGAIQYARFARALRQAERFHRDQGDRRLPPPRLRYRVHRALDEASYVRNGDTLADLLAHHLTARLPRNPAPRVLDFACGPGRVLAALAERVPDATLFGSDIDAEAIAWATDHLGSLATFGVNEFVPPSPFAGGSFDGIYSVSLFTHLDEAMQNLWLQELMRLLKPGGVLLATTHGALCAHVCTPRELAELDATGIVFRVDQRGRFKLDGLPDFYQTTFHTRDYVEREWARYGTVEDYLEGGVNQHQDLVILRKPIGGPSDSAAATASAATATTD